MNSIWDQYSLFFLDMDGTLYLGDKLIPGAKEFLDTLKQKGKKIVYLTNNSSKNKHSYLDKMHKLGINSQLDEFFTSGEATAIYLQKHHSNAKVFLLGLLPLQQDLEEYGLKIVNNTKEVPDVVLLGFDQDLTYKKIWQACDWIREGISYYATHGDFNCPLEGGKVMPDTGAMILMIEGSTGKLPKIIGKPNRIILEMASEKYDIPLSQSVMIGDRLYTDIRLRETAGIDTILVLSGETTLEMHNDSPYKASAVYSSVQEIINEL
ncbi:MAG: HAD-IIA family hydrolase [Brevinema sp.]